MVAAHDAFREMFAAGIIDRMPRLVGVQLQACDPTARAFHEGRDAVTPVDKKPSLSDAIMNNNPYLGTLLPAGRARNRRYHDFRFRCRLYPHHP